MNPNDEITRKMKYLHFLIMILCLHSCMCEKESNITKLVKEWNGKEIIFPTNSIFTILGKDTIDFTILNGEYKILSYIDSTGCTSCKLHLPQWKLFMSEVYSLVGTDVSFLFYFCPNSKQELLDKINSEMFCSPVCLDLQDSLNILNHFPPDYLFHTFLLNNENRILAIGNPVYNDQIKELYLNIIQGKSLVFNKEEKRTTRIHINDKSIFLAKFDWHQEQKAVFTLKNTGSNPLVIDNVTTSCGCTSVDYSKEPVRPGDSVSLHVTYKANHPEHFDKTITVYCNAKSSPITLRITGDAE